MSIIRSGEPDHGEQAGQAQSGEPARLGSGVKVCPVCEAEYLGWAVRCATCGVALVDPSNSVHEQLLRGDITVNDLDEDDQVIYELAVYTLAQRTELAELLADSGIPHAWDGEDLVVHVDDEGAVDGLCAQVEGDPPAPDPEVVAARVEALADPDTPAVSYELDEWEDDERERLSELLAQQGIAHLWDGTTLMIHADDEQLADAVMDAVEYPDALDAEDVEEDDDGEGGAGGAEMLSELFIAADVLQRDPTDTDAWQRLGDVLDESHPDSPPFGVDAAIWRDVMERGEALEELLDADTLDEDAVIEHANALRSRLRPLV
jgi:hypothetical protein